MAYYEPRDSRAYRVKRDRYSRPGGGYVEETYVDNRGGYGYDYDSRLARRHDSEESVVEEVARDFPPGEYYYGYPGPRRAATVREGARRARSVGRDPYYDEEYYRREDYRPRRSKRSDGRRDRYEQRSSYSSSRSPSPRPRRRKSMGEEALGAIGGALGIKSARDRSRDRSTDRGRSHRYHSDSRSRSRGHRAKSEARVAQAMKAALAAGAAEAFRVRKETGPWTGNKGRRVLTAAVSAGGVDGLIDRDPNKHGGRHVLESILAGMATNHFVNGSRSKSRSRNGSRGRSQSRGGNVRNMAAAGILAAAGKQAYDRLSRSRGRDRSDSRDSRDDGGRDSKKRGSSVSRALNKGLAALGLDDKNQSDRGRDRSTRSSDYSDSEDDRSYRSSGRRRRSSRDVRSQGSSGVNGSTSRAVTRRNRSSNGNIECHSDCDSDSDLGSSDDEKREKKKMLRRELVTGGLATVATIHAAHNVMKNIEAQKKRHEAVKEGAITHEQEQKMQMKANLKNVASIGLAAVGINGAYKEWKEVQEQRKEHKEFEEKCKERHEKRVQRRSQSVGGSRSSRGYQSTSASAAGLTMNNGHDYGTSGTHYYDSNPYSADIPVDF